MNIKKQHKVKVKHLQRTKNAILPKTLYRGKLVIFLLSNNHKLDLNIFNDTSLR